MNTIDNKLHQLFDLGLNVPFGEWCTPCQDFCYKVSNPYSKYAKEKLVLCKVDEGFNRALDIAIEAGNKWKKDI